MKEVTSLLWSLELCFPYHVARMSTSNLQDTSERSSPEKPFVYSIRMEYRKDSLQPGIKFYIYHNLDVVGYIMVCCYRLADLDAIKTGISETRQSFDEFCR